MSSYTRQIGVRHSGRILIMLVLGLLLVACNKHKAAAAATLSKVDACSLVSAAMVAKLSPNLGAGHRSRAPHPANVSTCVWDDAHHLPGLMLTVAPADPAGVAKGLEQGFAHMGYRIVPVSGLGDEAAVAIQMANPRYHTATAVAELEVRVGKRQLGFSPMRLGISGTNTPAFARLKQLAVDTIVRLKK